MVASDGHLLSDIRYKSTCTKLVGRVQCTVQIEVFEATWFCCALVRFILHHLFASSCSGRDGINCPDSFMQSADWNCWHHQGLHILQLVGVGSPGTAHSATRGCWIRTQLLESGYTVSTSLLSCFIGIYLQIWCTLGLNTVLSILVFWSQELYGISVNHELALWLILDSPVGTSCVHIELWCSSDVHFGITLFSLAIAVNLLQLGHGYSHCLSTL